MAKKVQNKVIEIKLISNISFNAFLPKILPFMQFFLKILSGMVNSVHPDQTTPLGAV